MIIITGASKGIGNYLAKQLSKNQDKIIGTYYKSDPEMISNVIFIKIDICNYNEVNKWVEDTKELLNNLILINCAGINYNSYAHKADINKWNEVIDVNVKGTFNVIHSLLPIMRNQNFGRIINFSSVTTSLPTLGVSAYSASKAAINGFTKVIAKENASKGITVNAINLGYSNIGMGLNDVPEEYQNLLLDQIPSKRFCAPFEILSTIEFIIKTEYLNGSIIDLNGALI